MFPILYEFIASILMYVDLYFIMLPACVISHYSLVFIVWPSTFPYGHLTRYNESVR